MKRHIIILLFLCILLCGCQLVSQGNGGSQSGMSTLTQNEGEMENASDSNIIQDAAAEDDPVPANVEIYYDASVEDLVGVGNDFLDAAFAGNTDEMAAFCDLNLKNKIQEDPAPYLGTKPEYYIDSTETIIRPGKEKGIYQLQTVVYAIKKDDNVGIKNRFSYLMDIEKVKGDYYITNFKKGKLQDGL